MVDIAPILSYAEVAPSVTLIIRIALAVIIVPNGLGKDVDLMWSSEVRSLCNRPNTMNNSDVDATVVVWELAGNFIPQFTGNVIIYPHMYFIIDPC